MTLVAELTLGGSLFGGVCAGLPDRTVELEDAYLLDEGRIALFLRFSDVDPAAVETILRDAPGVAGLRQLDGDDRSLFRVTLTAEARAETMYDTFVDHDITVVNATETGDQSRISIRVPTREALGVVIGEFGRRSVPTTLHRLSAEGDADDARYGLSAKQREALVTAWGAGYYRVPREATLADVGESLGISKQSVSQRLRRGLHSLIGATVAGRADGDAGGASPSDIND